MKNMNATTSVLVALGALLTTAGSLNAGVTITQQNAPAPTYDTLLTFDEGGTPTGVVASNFWQGSHGVTITDGVNGPATVIGDFSGASPWINSGNAAEGNFGVYLTFDQKVTALSFQAWDPSGAPDFFGNGLTIWLTDINDNVVDVQQYTGAWGGIGDSWFNITTDSGTTFQKVTITNNSFFPVSYVDNVSWTNVPAPGSFALIAAAGLVGRRRRRH
jgi:MYXO-CTERM domain-containing protein